MTCSRMLFLGVLIGGGSLTIATQPLYAQAAGTAAKAAPAPKAAAPTAAPKAAAPAAAKAPAAPATPAHPAGVPEAKLRSMHHQVEVVSSAERHGARKDEVIMPGTRVDSAAGSGAEVSFADGTRVFVGENTSFSVYGVPPPASAKGPAKKFNPGNNTITVGEITVVVPAAPAVLGAAAGAKKPAAPAKISRTATIVTPVGKVTVNAGSAARISVEPKTGATRVSLYDGAAVLAGKGKPINLAANQSSTIANVTAPPTAAQPLPAAPSISGVPGLVLSTGGPVEVKGTFAASGAPPAGFQVQVAQDAAFESLIRDNRVPATETRVMPSAMGPGDYYVRVSAINTEGAVGPWSAPAHVQVARIVLWPGGEGKRAAIQIDGKGVYCGLDGAELSAVGQPMPLQPAREHALRCATAQSGAKPEETSEFKISATQSGPVVAKLDVGAPTFTALEGQREVRLQLSDAAGSPISGANVVAEGTGGSRADAVRELPGTGTYVTTAHWPTGKTGLGLRYAINGVENYESALPDAVPSTGKNEPKEETPAGERAPAKSFAVELGLMPLTHVDIPRGVFAVGGAIEIGGRLKLPYGAFAFSLRPQYEYFAPTPGASHVVGGGLLLAYRFRSLDAAWAPYIGVLPQFLAEYSFLARDGIQIQDGSWATHVGIGGLLGAEIRLRRGAVFVEAGYRHIVYGRSERTDYASLNGVFGTLGYRVNF